MAASLIGFVKKYVRLTLFVLGCICCLTGVMAEQLNDPTRPAVELVPGMAGGDTDSAAPEKSAPQGLQSVLISGKRESAIINGIEVGLGEKYGDAILTTVNETCVVLVGPEGRQVLHMYPTVHMTKNQLACVKRPPLQAINKSAVKAKQPTKHKKKAKAKKPPVTCVAEEIKNGSAK